ncbi:uncharacterized protein LOC123037861 [Drosophila rhopaloa]|uniref:Endonuclease/exonuclease/phosphatase domain-containing protein n=1 Tax=Drosophila rhopaloa TaxID=1041015 RepID=A0ABM5JCA5_DRORH|nr:uncharacterized protein LOC123037861 [Drosophila rhopaloa]
MKILQANLHRSRIADDLLSQIVLEHCVDLVIICEQYRVKQPGIWLENEDKTAAIWIPATGDIRCLGDGRGSCYVYVQLKEFTIFSCYLTPNDTIEAFQHKIDDIEDIARQMHGSLIVAGDFNSRAEEWGMPTTNSRGRKILNMSARVGLVVANVGRAPTFQRMGQTGTIPDITLVSENSAHRILDWKVLDIYNGSDHEYISFSTEGSSAHHVGNQIRTSHRWNVNRLNQNRLIGEIDRSQIDSNERTSVESVVSSTMSTIKRACDASMPKSGNPHRRGAEVYWWTDEISALRETSLRYRRHLTRARRSGNFATQEEEYKKAKKLLNIAIRISKRNKWKSLCNDVNKDPWGLGYKLVMKKLRSRSTLPDIDEGHMDNIVKTLFPPHPIRPAYTALQPSEEHFELFSEDELTKAIGSMKNRMKE